MSKHSILVQWSDEDNTYIATVYELPGLSAFGPSPEEAVKELSIAKKAYLEVLEEDGEEIPEPDVLKPFSGQTRLRLPKTLHQSLTNEAKREGVSLNTYIVQLLSQKNILANLIGRMEKLEDNIHKAFLYTIQTPAQPPMPEADNKIIYLETKFENRLKNAAH